MKYLLYLDLALAALGATMCVVLTYVLLALWYNRATLPTYGADMPKVADVGLCALVLTAAAGTAAYGLWRRRGWRWLVQVVFLLLLPPLFALVRQQLRGS